MMNLIVTSSAINPSEGFTRQQLREIFALDFLCSQIAAYEEKWAEAVLQNKWENRVGWTCEIPAKYSYGTTNPMRNAIITEVSFDHSAEHRLEKCGVVLPEVDQSNLFLECSFLVFKPGRRDRDNIAIRFVADSNGLYQVNDFWGNAVNLLAEGGLAGVPERQRIEIFGRLSTSLHMAARDEILSPAPWISETDILTARGPERKALNEPSKRKLLGNEGVQ